VSDPAKSWAVELLAHPGDVAEVVKRIPPALELAMLDRIIGLRARCDVAERALLDCSAEKQAPSADDMLDVPEVAARLKLRPPRVYELVRTGKLEGVRIGKNVRVARSAVETFVTKRRA